MHLPERDPLGTPALPEDHAQAKQLAGRHDGLEGHGLLPAGEHRDSALGEAGDAPQC